MKNPNRQRALRVILLLGCAALAGVAQAAPVSVLQHTVGPQDNLYFDDWGHPWREAFVLIENDDGTPTAPEYIRDENPAPYAIGAGVPARSVQHAGSAFNFSGWDFVDVSASGLIRDRRDIFTGPDGDGSDTFRGLDVYSLIGIWSSSPDTIVPVGAWAPDATPAFDIGSSARLDIPQGFAVYLFLAENDGLFYDNLGSYSVTLTRGLIGSGGQVPLPGASGLLLGALALFPRRLGRPLPSALSQRAARCMH